MTDPNTRGTAKDNGSSKPETNTTDTSDNGSNSFNQPSLASRIQSSATNLAKSAFQPPTSAELSQSLAASTGNKAGQSSLQSTSPHNASASRDISTPGAGSGSGPAATGTQASTFRNESFQQGGVELPPLSEAEFHEQGLGLDQEQGQGRAASTQDQTQNPDNETDLQSTFGPWKGKQRARDPTQTQFETAWQRSPPTTTTTQDQDQSTTYTPNPNDGSGVLSLLSDPTFDPNMDEDPATLPETHPSLDRYAAPAPLSSGEIEAIEFFRKGARGLLREDMEKGREQEMRMQNRSGNATGSISGSSLIPDIDTFLMENEHGSGSGVVTRSGNAHSLRETVAAYLPGATDWMDVQERYVDDVWGYLEPVLEAAKEEIEDGQKEPVEGSAHADRDGPAVRRLKMILAHMKE